MARCKYPRFLGHNCSLGLWRSVGPLPGRSAFSLGFTAALVSSLRLPPLVALVVSACFAFAVLRRAAEHPPASDIGSLCALCSLLARRADAHDARTRTTSPSAQRRSANSTRCNHGGDQRSQAERALQLRMQRSDRTPRPSRVRSRRGIQHAAAEVAARAIRIRPPIIRCSLLPPCCCSPCILRLPLLPHARSKRMGELEARFSFASDAPRTRRDSRIRHRGPPGPSSQQNSAATEQRCPSPV